MTTEQITAIGDQVNGFCPVESRPFRLRKAIGVLLVDNGGYPLIGFAQFARLSGVQPDAVITAFDLGNAQFDQTAENLIHNAGIKRPAGRIHRLNQIGRGCAIIDAKAYSAATAGCTPYLPR